MKGNVFISWSGERSQKIGKLLSEWLPTVIQRCEPWISTEIDRGALWFQEVTDKLADSCIGVICLTKENLNAPWILFEAGALAKGLSQNRVCPLLIDLQSNEISSPLSQFNHTQPTKESMFKLLETLNHTLAGAQLAEETLHTVFERMWPDFENAFQQIIDTTPTTPSLKRSMDSVLTDIYDAIQRVEKLVSRNYPMLLTPGLNDFVIKYNSQVPNSKMIKDLLSSYYYYYYDKPPKDEKQAEDK